MAVDVRHHALLIDKAIAFKQIGVARVGVDHEFVDFREPVGLTLEKFVELHAKARMGIAHGEALIRGDLAHLSIVDELHHPYF